MTQSDGEVVEIHRSKGKLLGFLLIGVAFVAIGIWMTTSDDPGKFGMSVATWGWITIGFFGLCLGVFVMQLFGSKIALRIAPNGLTLKDTFMAPYGPIPWMDIAGLELVSVPGVTMLRITLSDPEDLQTRIGHRRYLIGKPGIRGGKIDFSLAGLSAGSDEILAAIAEVGNTSPYLGHSDGIGSTNSNDTP